jgi:hypothetical protein
MIATAMLIVLASWSRAFHLPKTATAVTGYR